MESLLQDGIEYIEIRSIDLNPFEADWNFIGRFTIYPFIYSVFT